MFETAAFQYDLPERLIAQFPPERRGSSRMMVLDRAAGTIRHERFDSFPSQLRNGDLLVLNNSRVIPARIRTEEFTGEALLFEKLDAEGIRWKAFIRPGRRWKLDATIHLAGQSARVEEILPGGERVIVFERPPDLERFGEMPLPPYVKRACEAADRDRYQTVFARPEGSVAAPTAGLHFTSEMLGTLPHAFVTLHVGPGTFKPVLTDDLRQHPMHEERFSFEPEVAARINAASRVIAVGTTSARVLETCATAQGRVEGREGRTSIFIHPPYQFRATGALLTNFHLPGSTLLMLVCAFAGTEFALTAYREAVREEYRFFSYGDCMLIV